MVTVHDGFYPLPADPIVESPPRTGRSFLRGIARLKTAYVLDKQCHLARPKSVGKVLNQDFNNFQFTRLNNVLAHGLDPLWRIPLYS